MVKVAITGAAGFLGSHIISTLLNHSDNSDDNEFEGGIQIIAMDLADDIRNATKQEGSDKYKQEIIDRGGAWKVGNLTDIAYVKACTSGCDMVLHTASLVDFGNQTKEALWNVNVKGTENILSACKENKVKVMVYASSLDVTCGSDHVDGVDESYPYAIERNGNPVDEYSRTKTVAEQLVLKAGKESPIGGLVTCSVRC